MKNILLLLLFLSVSASAQTFIFEKDSTNPDQPNIIAIPNSRGFINDRAHLFTGEEIVKLKTYMQQSGMDSTAVSVLTIIELEPFDSLEELATEYANMWELGTNNQKGILMVVSKNLKQSRIQVGEAYESIFTPSVLASIDAVMIPEFIKGDYYTGVLKALEKINELIK